jgi:hypothetical protein
VSSEEGIVSIAPRVVFAGLALGILLIGACAQRGPVRLVASKETTTSTLDSKLRGLSDNVRPVGVPHAAKVPQPYETKGELLAVLEELQHRRATLLERYTRQHPDIVDLDRQIAIVRQQIEMVAAQ